MARSQRRGAGCIEERRQEGDARNEAWRKLTPSQQMAALNARLGPGVGARRQRAKLNAQ